jgi:hypothetical protein
MLLVYFVVEYTICVVCHKYFALFYVGHVRFFIDFVMYSRQKGRYIRTSQVALEKKARKQTDKSVSACISKAISMICNTKSLFFPKK